MMKNSAFLIVDVQNDFIPGGALGVPEGDKIIPVINELQHCFDYVIATQDWHPSEHFSFENLWPKHCIQNTKGAMLVDALHTKKIKKIIYKGTDPIIDSYSAFFDNAHAKKTELENYLKSQKITTLYVAGLATDYCVKFSVLDALSLGYEVFVIEDACRGIEAQSGDIQKAFADMKSKGAVIIHSSDVLINKWPAQLQK